MSTVALELDRILESLDPKEAQVLETRVREAISSVTGSQAPPTLEEMKQRRPDIAHLIGAWSDEDPDEPEELPMPPAKIW